MLQPDQSFYDAALAILGGLGIPPTGTNVNLLVAWSYCEKPHTAGGAWQWNNPLNTTQPAPGAVSVNSDGVKSYPDQQTGAAACAQTIQNGLYPTLLAGLQQSNADLFFSAPGELSTWGTGWSCPHTDYAELPPYTPAGAGGSSISIGGLPISGLAIAAGALALAALLAGVEEIEGGALT